MPTCRLGSPRFTAPSTVQPVTGGQGPSPLLPRHLAEQVVARRGDIEGERKTVSVLFADLVGSTALAERLDPEDMVEILNDLFARWVTAIHRYEGTVDKFLGDGMLALFGAPLAHEDDPRRAVLAALEIRDETARYAESLPDTPIDVRIGINTGTVVVGTIGSDARMEYTAIGDAVNVAQRVESAAAPGSVFIADSTRSLVYPYFQLRTAGTFPLKGKPEPVPLFEVVRDLGVTTAARGVEGLHSPVVGRDEEMSRLEAAIERLRSGRGGVLGLVGEPGLGKSRLLAEARHMAAGISWAEGHALSYGASTPYLPLTQAIRTLAPNTDDPDLRDLLDGTQTGPVDGRRERIISASRAAVLARAPVVIAIEDLHWVDESSSDALEAIAPLASDHPVLIVVTSRPEGRENVVELGADLIEIGQLPHEASQDLVRNLLRLERIPAGLRSLIVDKAQGNPFFVEEFLRALIADGILSKTGNEWTASVTPDDLSVPTTLEALLASRIDRLPPESKRVLQAAAVLGRQFNDRVLDRLVETAAALPGLHSEGFLLPGDDPHTHVFKHVITQEVAYASALRRTRQVWHLAAGDAIEELYPGELGLRAAELGRHFDLGGAPGRALRYLVVAARQAADSYSHQAALDLSARALELAGDGRDRFELARIRTGVFNHLGRHEEEQAEVESMRDLAQALGDTALRLRALESEIHHLVATDYLRAYPLIDEALSTADQLEDRTARARLLIAKGLLERWQYAPERALTAIREAVDIFEDHGLVRDHAAALAELAHIAMTLGQEGALELSEKALVAARKSRDPQLIASALVRHSGVLQDRLKLAAAAEHAEQAVEVALSIAASKQVRTARIYLGHIYAAMGRDASSDAEFLTAQTEARAVGDALGWLSAALGYVECLEAAERFVEVLRWLRLQEPEAPTWTEPHNHSYIHYALGYRALRWFGRYEEAARNLRLSIEVSGTGASWNPPAVMFRNGLAWVLTDLGELGEARRVLHLAQSIAGEHQLEPVTLGYLLATDARLSIVEGNVAGAAEAIAGLEDFGSPATYFGEKHAAGFLSAELALAEGRSADALARARTALSLEPLRDSSRWFSRLQVLDLVARSEDACGQEASWPAVRTELERRWAELPEDCREPFLARTDVQRMVEKTGFERTVIQ